MIYEKIIRPIFFKTDPEKIHHFVIDVLSIISKIMPIYLFIRHFLNVDDVVLHTQIGKIKFSNPIGLAGSARFGHLGVPRFAASGADLQAPWRALRP